MRAQAPAAASLAALAIATAGCASSARPPVTANQAARERGIAAGHALNIGRSQPATQRPAAQLRLGILATLADPAGLAAVKLGYISARLAPAGMRLTITSYTSPAGEAAALAAGSIGAAYTTPAAAVTAWQFTHGGIRIISGAAATTSGNPVTVIAASVGYLRTHAAGITSLLQAQIQATVLLTTNPATGVSSARTELEDLLHHKVTKAAVSALARYQITCNPGDTGLGGIDNLTTINILLKASGLPPAN
jgi:hypothetical protein